MKVFLGLCALLIIASLLWAYQAGYRLNRTPSHPLGIYKIVDEPLRVGLYAVFCIPKTRAELPPLDEIYVPPCTLDQKGAFLSKRIVEIEADNDVYIVQGDHPKSLDSRIFGPLRASDIMAVMVPVWVWL